MAKKKKITKITELMRSGLKRVPGSLRDDFPQEIVQKMEARIEMILNNGVLGTEDLWLINYILKFIEFRAATWEEKVKAIRKINNAVAVAVKEGYFTDEKDEEIGGINRALLKKEGEVDFDSFKKRVKEIKERSKKYKK